MRLLAARIESASRDLAFRENSNRRKVNCTQKGTLSHIWRLGRFSFLMNFVHKKIVIWNVSKLFNSEKRERKIIVILFCCSRYFFFFVKIFFPQFAYRFVSNWLTVLHMFFPRFCFWKENTEWGESNRCFRSAFTRKLICFWCWSDADVCYRCGWHLFKLSLRPVYTSNLKRPRDSPKSPKGELRRIKKKSSNF